MKGPATEKKAKAHNKNAFLHTRSCIYTIIYIFLFLYTCTLPETKSEFTPENNFLLEDDSFPNLGAKGLVSIGLLLLVSGSVVADSRFGQHASSPVVRDNENKDVRG